ncbi:MULTISPECIES: transferase [Proteus]|uniref:Transferase n=1 Tax=Proteus penneri TaxID=102862 RepID=A0ABS0VZ95_9GAMM|nr:MULTISPECIES: transferase [Proteus]MBJ2116379.1 transferase [Proteus penneri]MCX2587051.1 transferase [Proteus penneri]NBL77016.1 transferase [Proteus sp. G2672]NBL89031.1 transferase [Proteus sp. G2673]NBM02255.1 transferase [Proteus sp. G2671]
MKKYIITNESKEYNGVTLFKIKRVYTGSPGGWIENESNLSREGGCFIYDDAMVFGNAKVIENAIISKNAKVYDNAIISGNASVSDNAEIYDSAVVTQNASIKNRASVRGNAKIEGNAVVFNDAIVEGNSVISGNEKIEYYIGNWEDIESVIQFTFYINHLDQESNICVNGKHQVPIGVGLIVLDKEKRHFKVSEEEMHKNIFIVDDKNEALNSDIHISKEAKGYIYPHSDNYYEQINYSACIWYVSVDKIMDTLKLCAQFTANGTKYTTAFRPNSPIYRQSVVTLNVIPPRVFTKEDMDIDPLIYPEVEKNVLMPGGTLSKYYLAFNGNGGAITTSAECEENKDFYYYHKNNYQLIGTSTDQSVLFDPSGYYTKNFHFDKMSSIQITSINKERVGLCFWTYSINYGLPFSSSKKEDKMDCIIRDQYGNGANVSVKADENNKLIFMLDNKVKLAY